MSLGFLSEPTVLLTGATGFIGAGIRSALTATGQATRILVRNPMQSARDFPEVVLGDLTDARSVDAALDGVTTVVHAASYVGSDPEEQRRVNIEGTRLLVEAAASRGVRQFVYISTFGVYGANYAAGITEDDAVPHPRSALSRSRYEAERIVLANGGTVVRPALVYGPGDRWVVPALVHLVSALGAWIDDGQQRVSAIDRGTLGRLIVGLTRVEVTGKVFHAARPRPVTIRQLTQPVLEHLGRPVPTASIGVVAGARRLAMLGVDESRIRMVTTDGWIGAQRIWAVTGLRPQTEEEIFTSAALDAYTMVI